MKKTFMLFLILVLLLSSGCFNMDPIENLSFMIGIGYDIDKQSKKPIVDPIELIVFKGNNEIDRTMSSGVGETIYNTVNDRQTIMSKKFIVGTEKLYLISEERARYGIEDLLEVLIRDEVRNELAFVGITDGDTSKYFNMEPIDNTSSSKAIAGLLKYCHLANFFPQNVTIYELLFMYNQSGRRIILPYIINDNGKPRIDGICVFDGAKMKHKIPLEEAFYINMLRSKSDGYISIVKDNNPKICYTIKAKNLVDVSVDYDETLIYNINVTLKGILKADSIDNKTISAKEAKVIQQEFEKKVKEELEKIVYKVQNQYQLDCFDITKFTAAKFGKKVLYLAMKNFKGQR